MNIPTELVIHIFSHLPSFFNIFNFAATCRKHRQVLHQHPNTIYNLTSHAILQCRHDARRLLGGQGVVRIDSGMMGLGFLQLCLNLHVMENIIERFGNKFIGPFCCSCGMLCPLLFSIISIHIHPWASRLVNQGKYLPSIASYLEYAPLQRRMTRQ